MAKYTIELRTIVESGHNIFDFPYEFYDEEKRQEFENKFIQHFYFREIGSETIDRFKHYLRDKMLTVFPYYNKLFETTLVEYDLVNNYNVTETHTINRENKGRMSGISSDVGQYFGNQETETTQDTTTDTTGTAGTTGKDTETEHGTTVTDSDGTSSTETTSNNEATGTKSNSGTKNGTTEDVKKFMDTPQGLTNLDDINYLTNLHHDEGSTFESFQDTEQTSSKEEGSGTSDTVTTDDTTVTSDRETVRNSVTDAETSQNEVTHSTAQGTSKDEQKTTHDNNTRSEHMDSQSETFKREMYGNIGVQTATDMLEKHIEYQKKITKIELMFFEECEDLFMLVW